MFNRPLIGMIGLIILIFFEIRADQSNQSNQWSILLKRISKHNALSFISYCCNS